MPNKIVVRENVVLKGLVWQAIHDNGPACDLNHLDVSGVTDFSDVFKDSPFVGDISSWDTRSAKSMNRMFKHCPFNGDISQWNVECVREMLEMFKGSSFNQNISAWSVVNLRVADAMLYGNRAFRGDLSKWVVHPSCTADYMLEETGTVENDGLWLPLFSSFVGDIFYENKERMHTYLARVPMSRYHWDALLREPWSPWATPEMQMYLDVAGSGLPVRGKSERLFQGWLEHSKDMARPVDFCPLPFESSMGL